MAKSEERTYTIKLIKEEDIENVISLLRRTFYIDEPMNESLQLCPNGICPELDDYCKGSLLEGLSFKAVDKDGNIVGVTISGAFTINESYQSEAKLLAEAEKCKNPKFKRILHVLAQREHGADLLGRYPDQKLLEVKVASTDPLWRRMGIMNALIEQTELAAKRRGITLLRMDTSSAYSAKSAERLGFTCIYEALYSKMLKDGEPLVLPKPPHLFDKVYIKDLRG